MENIKRKSNYELLRILCIFGIICMHTLGPLREKMNIINGEIALLLNSVFNAGVTIFVLISGYFGIKIKENKIFKLWLMVLFYSLISFGIETYINNSFSIKELIKSCIPIISRKYWFISCYFVLCFLSSFINEMFEKFNKETNKKLIITLLIFFSIIPTIFQMELMNDGGKGIVNMILAYLIGRYISLYNIQIDKKRIVIALILSILFTFIAMSAISYLTGKVTLGYFFRDNSIIMIIIATCILMLFGTLNIKSKRINDIAKYVLSIYIFESIVRKYILDKFINLELYADKIQFYIIIFVYCIVTMIICIIIEKIRYIIFDRFEKNFIDKILFIKEKVINKSKKLIKQ